MDEIKTHCRPWVYPFVGGNHEDHPNNVQSIQNLHPGSNRSAPRTKVDTRKTSEHLRLGHRTLNRAMGVREPTPPPTLFLPRSGKALERWACAMLTLATTR